MTASSSLVAVASFLPNAAGRVLGVDLGLKRTGLAISDALRITTRALPNRIPQSRADDVRFLTDVCLREEVAVVVIGYALMTQTGDEGMMAKRARGFAQALQASLLQAAALEGLEAQSIGVYLLDEAGTSRTAASRLVESGVAKHKRKAMLDGEAARVLVEDFCENFSFYCAEISFLSA